MALTGSCSAYLAVSVLLGHRCCWGITVLVCEGGVLRGQLVLPLLELAWVIQVCPSRLEVGHLILCHTLTMQLFDHMETRTYEQA